jgi:osmotically-inducible protein OsmY
LAISNVEGLDEALDVVFHVREGEVLLGGFVDNGKIRDSIVKATRSVKDVKKVHDKLSLRN